MNLLKAWTTIVAGVVIAILAVGGFVLTVRAQGEAIAKNTESIEGIVAILEAQEVDRKERTAREAGKREAYRGFCNDPDDPDFKKTHQVECKMARQ